MKGDILQNNPKTLMQLAKAGDRDAFGRLYEIYFAPVFRYIYFRLRSKENAEDLVQIVFLKAFRSLPNFKEQNKEPLAYFFTIARNSVIDHWRKHKEVLSADPEKAFEKIPDKAMNPLRLAEREDVQRVICEAIGRLPEDQQEVMTLKFINELSNKEIASLLSKTQEAVRQLQCRALQALREILKAQNRIHINRHGEIQ